LIWIKAGISRAEHLGPKFSKGGQVMALDKTTALLRIPALHGLPKPLIARLADISGMQRIGKGSTLFREGERAQFVYGLVEGSVSLVSSYRREETIADFMEAGEIILIPPALLELPYMVTGKAVTDLLVILIPAADFRHMAETELPFSAALNRLLAAHWRFLLRHLTQTKFRDADTRLIQYLMDGAGVTQGAARVALPGSKKELAAHLGMTPETLSRSFKRIGRLGVKSRGSEIQIENVSRLENIGRHSTRAARR
jgi:CRP/FNR family transcriptional activator FtrB